MVLKPSEAQTFYDRFGAKQGTQGFYEDRALDDLIANAGFGEATSVFEFGCGTGRLAARLLEQHLSAGATYSGCDLSATMVGLAKRRLAIYEQRARVVQSDGAVKFPFSDHSVDRVVTTYVLDLLSESAIEQVFLEAHRILKPGGKFCVTGLTSGTTVLSWIISSLWRAVFHLHASLVGGCRPLHLSRFVDTENWQLEHRNVVIQFGVPSEVVVAAAKLPYNKAPTRMPQGGVIEP
ncbi:MAG TPA: methyltransferase domain-containing protein [Gammaproteobacteria bacterium]|nr:methyltransferase domain-containing protein [Gammaproteobacteria bacterium]